MELIISGNWQNVEEVNTFINDAHPLDPQLGGSRRNKRTKRSRRYKK